MTTEGTNPSDLPFTDAARQVLADARTESEQLKHDYVGTEHIVLALTRHPAASATLTPLGIRADQVRALIIASVTPGRGPAPPSIERPYTSRTKRAFNFASDSARAFGHTHVDVGHLLVGLLRERKNIGAEVLQRCGLTLERATGRVQSDGTDTTTDDIHVGGVSNDSGAFYISFQLVPGLTSEQRVAFMCELLSEDVHPGSVEVDENGAGMVRYSDLWPEGAEEAADIRRWLSLHPLVRSVG